MLRAFRDLRISIKAMLPILLLALVGLGAGGLIARTLVTTDTAYSSLLDREAKASTHAARLNALVLGLGREVWEATALRDPAVLSTAIRNIEAMAADATARATPIRAGVAGTPAEAELARFERDFPGLVAGAVRGLKQVQAGQATEGMAFLQGDFARSFTELRNLSRKIMNDLLAATNARSVALSAESESAARTAIVVLGLGIALSLAFGIWLTRATILQPFARLGDTVQHLAAGNYANAVADAERGDEVGAMARALQGLAGRLQEAATLRDEQEALQRRAEQARRDGLLAMADSLESSVGTVVEGIASATTELSAAATSMVGIADATSQRASTVSGATAVASGNVGTVAAATEELAASVAEISRQVSDSARMAAGAVDQANRTNATVANLTEAAAKIGEVDTADQRHRRPDQPAGAERDDRGGPRRGGRQGLRGGGVRGEGAGQPDRPGHRGASPPRSRRCRRQPATRRPISAPSGRASARSTR